MARSKQKSTDYAELTSKEDKQGAVDDADSVKELEAMWAVWEKRGYSKDGLLYAAVLERKQGLGVKLSEGDLERIELAEKRRAAGAELPPITGKRKG
jgi:hypothetical protein